MPYDLPVILVFSPYYRGFYLGEVTRALLQLAVSEKFNILHVRSGGYNEFDLPLAIAKAHGVISVLDAISPELIDDMLALEIPIVSIGHDYFPQQVEYVSGDNRSGIYQTFAHLVHKGCRRIGFAGDFSVSDMRIRMQAYKEAHKKFSVRLDDNRIYSINNGGLQGGADVAQEFIQRQKNCDAIMFAADKYALGFASFSQRVGIQIPKDVLITGYDNTYIGKNSFPAISSVDQNIPKLVSYAVNRILSRIKGENYAEGLQLINPKFIARHSSNDSHSDDYDETPVSSIAKNPIPFAHENPLAIAAEGLAGLKNYSDHFGPFMDWTLMAEIDNRVDFFEKVHLEKVNYGAANCSDIYVSDWIRLKDYPLQGLQHKCPEPFMVNLLPLPSNDQRHALITSMTNLSSVGNLDGLVDYHFFLEIMSKFVAASPCALKEEESRRRSKANQAGFSWSWDLNSNQVAWGSKILEMLGYSSSVEKNIYGKMGFFERVHPDDIEYVRGLLKSHLESGNRFVCQFRLGSKELGYIWVKATGKSIKNEDGNVSRLAGRIAEIPHQHLIKNSSEIYLVQHDQLTGLPSRRFLYDDLIDKIKTYPEGRIVIMWLDLNRFGQINDSYGHAAGDRLLRETAEKIRGALGPRHLFSRFSSDEFVIISRVRSQTHAMALGRKVLKTIESPFTMLDGSDVTVTASMGLSMYPETSSMVEDLFKQADIASTKAKKQRIAEPLMYSAEITKCFTNRVTMESALRQAIDNNELYMVYQPQIEIKSGEVVGVESLCRWHSKQLGRVAPEQFIPVAEETGIIHTLGDWVIDTSLNALQSWRQRGLGDIKLSVNVSANQLMDPSLIKRFREKLLMYGIDQPVVAIEVTETAAIDDLQKTCDLLKEFVDLGVQISLDDFGTGFSSLCLLKDLPLEWVKIDKSFIDNIVESLADQSIVRSICMLGHSLGYKVVVEGVEHADQLDIVADLGCDVVQGFVYSKPLSQEEVIANFHDFHRKFKIVG